MEVTSAQVHRSALAKLGAVHSYVEKIKVTKSLEELIEEVNSNGWQVNNLFQLPNGMWRSNIRAGTEERGEMRWHSHEYADAATAAEAMTAAIWNMRQKRNDPKTGKMVYPPTVIVAMKRNEVARARLGEALNSDA